MVGARNLRFPLKPLDGVEIPGRGFDRTREEWEYVRNLFRTEKEKVRFGVENLERGNDIQDRTLTKKEAR